MKKTLQVTIDDCSNCDIFISPTPGSVFIRNTKNSRFAISSHQFRTRDCSNLDVSLHCANQPIIESSSGITFHCFSFKFPELEKQLEDSDMKGRWWNLWWNIHDFNPGAEHFQTHHDFSKNFNLPTEEINSSVDLRIKNVFDNSSEWIIPISHGTEYLKEKTTKSVLIAFFNKNDQDVMKFISSLNKKYVDIKLIQTLSILSKTDSMFPNMEKDKRVAMKGFGKDVKVIGLEFRCERDDFEKELVLEANTIDNHFYAGNYTDCLWFFKRQE